MIGSLLATSVLDLDEVLPTWLDERPRYELVIVATLPGAFGVLATALPDVATLTGYYVGAAASAALLAELRAQVATERLQQLREDPLAALDDVDRNGSS